MTAVRIPPVLRTHGRRQQAGRGRRARRSARCSTAWSTSYPGLREQLLTADGGLHRFVNVYLNGQDVRYLPELDTPVGERTR